MISGKILTRKAHTQTLRVPGFHCPTVLLPSHAVPDAPCNVLSLGRRAWCDHVVCNSNVVWFPLCCKGQKSPALPRPDAAAGECHKSWRSLSEHECTNERERERGSLLSYVGLHSSHERDPVFVRSFLWLFGSDTALRFSPSVNKNEACARAEGRFCC